jgi:hypothetical protein
MLRPHEKAVNLFSRPDQGFRSRVGNGINQLATFCYDMPQKKAYDLASRVRMKRLQRHTFQKFSWILGFAESRGKIRAAGN